MTPDSAIGLVIGDRFRITRFIGEGGMGGVYEAEHKTLARRFALKVLHKNLGMDRRFVERFRREAVAASRVEHPNIVQISDFGQVETGEFYIVMEYLEGIGLDSLLRKQGRLPLARAISILVQIADALDYAHRNKVVHRDLKPENVLLSTVRGQTDVVKILDFGIAMIQTHSFAGRLTLQGQIFGTAEYVSPEQALDREIDGRSDLYALGILAFELTTGTVPFEGSPAEVLQAHVQRPPPPPSMRVKPGELPAVFDQIVLRLLAKNPDQRMQTGAEVRRELLRLRALLSAASKGLYDRGGRRRLKRRIEDTGGWRPLGSRPTVPPIRGEIASGAMAAMHDFGPTTETPLARTPNDTEMRRSAFEVRRQIHITMRKIGLALAEAAIRPKELREVLRAILKIEEEMAVLGTDVAKLEQNFEQIRFDTGERETALRYAIMDLGIERSKRISRKATTDELADFDYQIGELQKRLQEVSAERQNKTQQLAESVHGFKSKLAEREQTVAERYHALAAIIEKARPQIGGDEFGGLYSDLEGLRATLERVRAQS